MGKELNTYRERIYINPSVHFGKPCIINTRIPVEDVLELVQEGIPFDQITEEYYPDLEIDDVKACVAYAVDVVRAEKVHVQPT